MLLVLCGDVLTHRFLLRLSCQGVSISGSLHVQRLVRALVVVETDPVADHATGMPQGLETVAMHTLLLERTDDTLDHAVLLRAVGRDELLLQPIALDQRRVAATGEDQTVV